MFFQTVRMCSLVAVIAVALFSSYAGAAENGFSYEISFDGISDKVLLSDIKSISDTLGNSDHTIASEYLLQKRADNDIRKFLQLLKARGFYDASVQAIIKLTTKEFKLTFKFQTGDPYLLKSVSLTFSEETGSGGLKLPDAEKLGLFTGNTFTSVDVLDAQEGLIRFMRRKGFPLAKIADRDVLVDHKDHSVSVSFKIDTGQRALFGPTTISGLVNINESYISGKLPWKEGDPYNGDLIDEARKIISELGLFTSLHITEGKDLNEGSKIPMMVEVIERKHKSISVGINYITNIGPGTKISWENRNVFHQGEKLTTHLELSKDIRAAEGTFRKQDFMEKDQTLRFDARLGKDHTDAYDSKSITGSVFIDRDLTKKMRIGAGITMKSSKEEQLKIIERFNMISLPLYYNLDTSNDLLDPVNGHRLSLQVTPFYELTRSRITFSKIVASYKRYQTIFKKPSVTVAAEIKAGSIEGAGRNEIAPSERFYAGGGGSIRGYSFQSVGPRSEGVSVGGRSLIESSVELRFKITEHFGLATFLDGGSAFADKMFSSHEPLRWGTGMGARYYTPVGPFRLDVGIPLNKRKGVDGSYQLYISLGQAF
jgi:translocation and assembly module TamA